MSIKEQKNSTEILSVSQLNKTAKLSLEKKFHNIWVRGEISKFTNHQQSGHWYFSLKDQNASIDCAMFKSKNSYLKNIPEIGDEITLKGKLSLFEAQGRYQFIAEILEYSGEGDLLKAFEKLKIKLLDEGLFEESFKKEIPDLPMHIGVVTSPTGAVLQDIKNVLRRRAPLSKVTLSPSTVQGEKAESEIIYALKMLQELDKKEKIDLIIIARGGGSIEDLWCFNSEKLAREIYAFEIPIISAVGHETDFTICDLVSDLRAPTPSAAAEIISQTHSQLKNKIKFLEDSVQSSLNEYIGYKENKFIEIFKILKKVNFNLDQKIFKVDEVFNKMIYLKKEKLSSKKLNLALKKASLRKHNPFIKLSNQKAILLSKKTSLKNVSMNLFLNKRNIFKTFASKLQAFSPLEVLSRGYTVSTKNNQLLDKTNLKKGDEIFTRTQKNIISSKIINIDELE